MRTRAGQVEEHGSIRILQTITPGTRSNGITRFGFEADKHPPT